MIKVIKCQPDAIRKTKKGIQKRLVKNIKIFPKKTKTKCEKYLVKDIKIFQKKKKKRQYRRKRHKNLYKMKIKGQQNVEEIII